MRSKIRTVGETRDFGIQPGPFEPTYESLGRFECPAWIRDAKLGIWAHWGPQSVPMFGDWYARNLYIPGNEQYRYHWRTYGHPSKVGYKDIVARWRAENFDPESLMDLYAAAGARYFVAQAAHHDNFDNWNSKHHRWNAVEMGPRKDIVGLWARAARKRGLRFGISEHLAAAFCWSAVNKNCDPDGPFAGVPYDGNDPACEDFYLPNRGEVKEGWYSRNPWWHRRWFARLKDVIDQHQPDLLYSDGDVPFGEVGLNIIAHLYNSSVKRHGTNEAIYTQKNREPVIRRIGVLDIELGVEREAVPYVWQTDSCVGGWFYDARRVYKTARQVIEMLVDIASKNGALLLNLPQRPDGTLDDECRHIAERMAVWFKVNGAGIHGTRPWTIAAEGPTVPEGGAFKESVLNWTSEDYRFTARGDRVYAFQMRWPADGKALIRALAPYRGPKVEKVELLGCARGVAFKQTGHGLEISLPPKPTSEYAHCFCIHTRPARMAAGGSKAG